MVIDLVSKYACAKQWVGGPPTLCRTIFGWFDPLIEVAQIKVGGIPGELFPFTKIFF